MHTAKHDEDPFPILICTTDIAVVFCRYKISKERIILTYLIIVTD